MILLRRLAAALLVIVALGAPGAGAQKQQNWPDEVNQAVEQFGGLYQDPELQRYVEAIGKVLVATTEKANDPFTFGVLDSPIVNAFSLPGGYVFVTRGLIALANNEAELASVIGHEIGHVVADHASGRMTRGVIAQLGAGLLGALLGNPNIANVAGAGAQLYLQHYSRDQEYEADERGITYMARAGYDTRASVAFLTSLETWMKVEGEIANRPMGDAAYNMLADHPRTADRVERAREEAAGAQTKRNPITERDIFLGKIDGMVFGDDPRQGIVRDRRFIHPELGFAFEVPTGFNITNTPAHVQAEGPDGAAIVFDRAPQPFQGAPADYLATVWAKSLRLGAAERIDVNGLDGATAAARAQTKEGGTVDLRLVAIRFDARTYYRFLFVTAPNVTGRYQTAFERTTFSFHRLTPGEAKEARPTHVRVLTVRPGDTPASIAERMPFDKLRLERFLALNALPANAPLRPGDKVKTIE